MAAGSGAHRGKEPMVLANVTQDAWRKPSTSSQSTLQRMIDSSREQAKVVKAMPLKTKEAQRAFQRNWIRKRRLEYFADKCCVECGSTQNLNLDHIDPEQKESHNIWSWKRERREAELAKCQVLCFPCHVKKTAAYRRLNAKGRKPRDPVKAKIYRDRWRAKKLAESSLLFFSREVNSVSKFKELLPCTKQT